MSSEMTESNALERPTGADAYTGQLFVVCSPSGGGKGTLIRHVLENVSGVSYSVSWTTRSPRAGELDGIHYHFVTRENFERIRESGGFLEWAEVHGNLYGTARSVVEQELREGRDVILEIDVQGAASVRSLMKNTVGIFILPPSYDALRERLTARGTDQPNNLELRMRNACWEVRRYEEFDYVIINDDAKRASQQLASIFFAERAKRGQQDWAARRVLQTFPASREVE